MSELMFNALYLMNADLWQGLHRVVFVEPQEDCVLLFHVARERQRDDDESTTNSTDTSNHRKANRSIEAKHRQVVTAAPDANREGLWEWVDPPHAPTPIRLSLLQGHENAGHAKPCEYRPHATLLTTDLTDTDAAKPLWLARVRACAPFLDPQELHSILLRGYLGKTVASIAKTYGHSRSHVYSWFYLLCRHGFSAGSLMPRFDACGAPGVPRPCESKKVGRKTNHERLTGSPPSEPQVGTSEEHAVLCKKGYMEFKTPHASDRFVYDRTVEKYFVKGFVEKADGLEPIPMNAGTFPNLRQFLFHGKQKIDPISVLRRQTTPLHFERNHRGISGRSWQGIRGPGHVYQMDSTVADIYLRSSVCRAWFVGRPVLYVIIDVWSTAIVGWYCCLTGPSWSTAKTAIFCSAWDPVLIGSYWGYQATACLDPVPTIPSSFLFDRGEYLSAGAAETAKHLMFGAKYAAAYRPDWKGLVEVMFRLLKDTMVQFMPGAIDSRRKEIELRTDAKTSVLTLSEFAHVLYILFVQYNLLSDRSARLDQDMIAAGVHPSPAGLWHYGHSTGIGVRHARPRGHLIKNLLPEEDAVITGTGLRFSGLPYEAEIAQHEQWTALARNFGARTIPVSYFPGSNRTMWWLDRKLSDYQEFSLASTSRAKLGTPFCESLDVFEYQRARANDLTHSRLITRLTNQHSLNKIIDQATALTKEADAGHSGPRPNSREARVVETEITASAPTPPRAPADLGTGESDVYAELMCEVFAAANAEAA